jgi:hypothetical protein
VALGFVAYAHCARCGNFDLDRIPANRVDPGIFNSLKRLLSFPAYRCDPCRGKFFSLRPYRKIVPSIVPDSEHLFTRS